MVVKFSIYLNRRVFVTVLLRIHSVSPGWFQVCCRCDLDMLVWTYWRFVIFHSESRFLQNSNRRAIYSQSQVWKQLSISNSTSFPFPDKLAQPVCRRPRWLSRMLIMKYFLRLLSPFRRFKKGSCQFLAKEYAQLLVNHWQSQLRKSVAYTVEPQWLEHGNSFETWVVRATES